MKKNILCLLILGFLLAGCKARPAEAQYPSVTPEETYVRLTEATGSAEETQPEKTGEERFLLTFTGDNTLGCGVNYIGTDLSFQTLAGEDYSYPYKNVVSYFRSDDATFANLEGPLTDTGFPAQKKHAFSGPESYVNMLSENSVDFVSLANNHSQDYGKEGYANTQKVLKEKNIPFVERDQATLLTLDRGLTIGVYGVVYYRIDEQELCAAVEKLKKQADLVIVAAHWGSEGSYHPHREQISLAHAAIDAGADIVWGHHPHVLQNMEKYKDGIICYSLGNFSFGGYTYPGDFDTALVQIEVIKDAGGNVSLGEVTAVPCSVSSREDYNNYQPTPLPKGSEAYERVVSKLDGSYDGPTLTINKQA